MISTDRWGWVHRRCKDAYTQLATVRERQEWITEGICPDCGEYITMRKVGRYIVGKPCGHVREYRARSPWTESRRLLLGLLGVFAFPVIFYAGIAAYDWLFPLTCRDGWGSPSIGRRGACSHHGGVVQSDGPVWIVLGSLAAGFAVYITVKKWRSS
jgi:hypothetical protein